jgi:hypothetical protein
MTHSEALPKDIPIAERTYDGASIPVLQAKPVEAAIFGCRDWSKSFASKPENLIFKLPGWRSSKEPLIE